MDARRRTSVAAWLALLIFILLYVSYWALYLHAPRIHAQLVQGEDRAVEWLTVLGFGISGILCAAATRLSEGRAARLYFTGFTLFCVLCVGEEISWGQRLLGFETPPSLAEHNEQKEFNLHNISWEHLHPKSLVVSTVEAWGILAPLLLMWPLRRFQTAAERYVPPPSLIPCFLLIELINLVEEPVARWVAHRSAPPDADFVLRHAGELSEELQEMFLSLSVLVAICFVYAAGKRRHAAAAKSSA